MATTSDLMGLGMAPGLAGKAGHQIAGPLPGIGTAQVGAQALTGSVFVGAPTSGQTAYTLPSGAATMAKEFYFFNAAVGATTALIYPPTGGATLNGSTSAAVSVAQNKGAMFMLVANSGGAAPQWVALAGA